MWIISIWFSWCHCHPIISCSSKIQIGLTFLVLAYTGCPGKEPIKWMSVCLGVKFLSVSTLQTDVVLVLTGWWCNWTRGELRGAWNNDSEGVKLAGATGTCTERKHVDHVLPQLHRVCRHLPGCYSRWSHCQPRQSSVHRPYVTGLNDCWWIDVPVSQRSTQIILLHSGSCTIPVECLCVF